MSNQALLIFAKNPEAGKVKTRLAATMGNEAALTVYLRLLAHSVAATEHLPVDKFLFYSDHIEQNDVWNNNRYNKQIQTGNDLGERMKNAFEFVFQQGYDKAVIIGTDCPSLSDVIVQHALAKLDNVDVVIGPAFDGGYYLLGMNRLYANLFIEMEWSTSKVLPETIYRCKQSGFLFLLLQTLNDVDEEKDLPTLKTNDCMKEQLLFVYNADSDLFSTVSDFAHKIISPLTYKCQLCALTYGSFSMKQEWKTFIEKLPVETMFLYKDEFKKQYQQTPASPVVFLLRQNGSLTEIISKKEIKSCKSLKELENTVTHKINLYVQHHYSNI